MKNFILFILCSLFISAQQNVRKIIQPNINEVLWLKKKYNIVRLRTGCYESLEGSLAIAKQENEIVLKYGNLFWERIDAEVDSIEKKNLGYKKTELSDLEKYLNSRGFSTGIPPFPEKKPLFAVACFTINATGQLSNIELDTNASNNNFGTKKSEKFRKRLTIILDKVPVIRPSTFLNEGIDDAMRIFIKPIE